MDTSTIVRLKNLAQDPAFIAEMKAVFFEAMIIGYASEEKLKKSSIAELPGSKLIPPYVKGPWKVSDPYLVTPLSSFSGGTTIISYEGVPVWMMQYFGQYPKEAVPCLKAALRTAYENRQFFGGRGPESFGYGPFRYTNYSPRNVWKNHRFGDRFNGDEEVRENGGKLLGWHTYHGGLMF